MTKRPKFEFVIRYRSGAEVTVRADELSIKWDRTEQSAVEMTWKNMQPHPMAIGLGNIESVWEVV